jgi:hypothetical protein
MAAALGVGLASSSSTVDNQLRRLVVTPFPNLKDGLKWSFMEMFRDGAFGAQRTEEMFVSVLDQVHAKVPEWIDQVESDLTRILLNVSRAKQPNINSALTVSSLIILQYRYQLMAIFNPRSVGVLKRLLIYQTLRVDFYGQTAFSRRLQNIPCLACFTMAQNTQFHYLFFIQTSSSRAETMSGIPNILSPTQRLVVWPRRCWGAWKWVMQRMLS